MQKINRGDIFYADLNPVIGSEQGSYRPVLVVQNRNGNEYSPTVVTVPITGNLRKNPLPTHVMIPKSYGLDKDSIALVEQIRTIDRSRFADYIGRIDYEIQSAIDNALAVSVGLEKRQFSKNKVIVLSLCPRCESDFRNNGYLLVKRGYQAVKTDCDFCQQPSKGLIFGILN